VSNPATGVTPDVEARFARFVEAHQLEGVVLGANAVCADRPDLLPAVQVLIEEYLKLSASIDGGPPPGPADSALPVFPGFRTIERLGGGGMGEVYKVEDLTLHRTVAAKVLRPDVRLPAGLVSALKEARSLALFRDPRIVQVHEYRADSNPPVIILEYVDGFELGQLAPSLEYRQRARIVREICEAIHHAHTLGLQHRDLKPSNIMLDAALSPKILDFGLSSGDPARGHLVGTPSYVAPEQLDPGLPIDARTDVYGLGAVLYEVLCQAPPHVGGTPAEIVASVREGHPRLPVEIVPSVPEPLQAIALKALERDPAQRYQSAREMALDLGRYLDGLPVLARPSQYTTALAARVKPHLEQIQDWLRLRLIHPHEATSLARAYRQLDGREDDWIVASRSLSYSQIALYLGAFFLIAGSLFYFVAHRFHQGSGVMQPFFVLALPFVGLNVTAHYLARREHRAVSVAFYLAGVVLLPLFLLILFYEKGLWVVPPETAGQLFQGGEVSNRQLQVTVFVACAWAAWLAVRTRTAALSTVFTLLLALLALAVLTDHGLRQWFLDERYDYFALHLAPLAVAYLGVGLWQERARGWFALPLFVAAVLVEVVALELLALDGRAFGYLGFSLQPFQPATVSNVLLLDTLAAMTLNGLLFYLTGTACERHGPDGMRPAAALLFVISPFAVLEPLGFLAKTGEYAKGWDWVYLVLALSMAVLSHRRQRRGFYYAGVLNSTAALYLIADHREWFDERWWAMTLVAAGLGVLAAGYALAGRERRK